MTAGGDAARPLAWKGLDTSQMPVFIGYDQVERMVAALTETAAAWQPDAVVGIARGGQRVRTAFQCGRTSRAHC